MNKRILILSGHSWVDNTENLPEISGHNTMPIAGNRQIVDTKVLRWSFLVHFMEAYIEVSDIDGVEMILFNWKDHLTFTHYVLTTNIANSQCHNAKYALLIEFWSQNLVDTLVDTSTENLRQNSGHKYWPFSSVH